MVTLKRRVVEVLPYSCQISGRSLRSAVVSMRVEVTGVSNCAVKGNQKEKKELKYQRDENDTWLSQDQTCYRLLQRQILQPEDFPVFSENTSFAALMWECNGANQH